MRYSEPLARRIRVRIRLVFSRRTLLAALLSQVGTLALPAAARAFGNEGAFRVRMLQMASLQPDESRVSAASRWAWELARRTSASANLAGAVISAASPKLLDEPFAVWFGARPCSLTSAERRNIERFLRMGGLLVVDDSDPQAGTFAKAAQSELRRILPSSPIQPLPSTHVIFKSFYMLDQPMGRVHSDRPAEAMMQGHLAQVIFCHCDLLGALATTPSGDWVHALSSNNGRQREFAIRFAVNLAMYVLCSDYKDDQVHAAWLMRNRQPTSR